MKRGINLKLPKKKASQVGKKSLKITAILLLVSFVLGVALVGYNLFLGTTIQNLADERNDLRNQILAQNTKVYKLQDTHARLKNIQAIADGRLKAIDKVDVVAGILPEEVEVLSIDTEALAIDYSVKSPDLSQINSILEERVTSLAADTNKSVKVVELSSLVFDPEEREYTLNFKVTF